MPPSKPTNPREFVDRPFRQPVDLRDADTNTADALIGQIVQVAAAAVPETPDGERFARKLVALVRGANHMIADGLAADGARVEDLAAAAYYSGDKHAGTTSAAGPVTSRMLRYGSSLRGS